MARLVLGGREYESHVEIQSGDRDNTVTISIRDPNMPSVAMAMIHLDLDDCNKIRRWFNENFPKRQNGGSTK